MTTILKAATVFFLIVGAFARAWAGSIWVPDDHATIQEALNAASSGDVIHVRNGTYKENIVWPEGRGGITLRSENGPKDCIIDGGGADRVFFIRNVDSATRLIGFTIRNGLANSGAGIQIEGSPMFIANNIITANATTGDHGAGLHCRGSNAVITKNTFSNNFSPFFGGAMECVSGCGALISSNLFTGNSAKQAGAVDAWGAPDDLRIVGNIFRGNTAEVGAAIVAYQASPQIVNNLIVENTANKASGIFLVYSWAVVTNCTISNPGSNTGGIVGDGGGEPKVVNSIIWPDTVALAPETFQNSWISHSVFKGAWPGNQGNLDADPLFMGGGSYRLKKNSPCIDAGTSVGAPDKDISGKHRPRGGGVDMGAYEAKESAFLVVTTDPDPPVGDVPFNVTFNSTSPYTIQKYSIDYGDGSSPESNKTGLFQHEYAIGTCLATVTARSANGVAAQRTVRILAQGLAAYYPFNGNADDASGNGRHGVVYGATPARDRMGKGNSAYSFVGTERDHINVDGAGAAISRITDAITLAAWIKPMSLGIPIMNKYGDFILPYGLGLGGDGELGFAILVLDRSEPTNYFSERRMQVGKWYHVAATYDGTTVKFYINGKKDSNEPTFRTRLHTDEVPLLIGQFISSPSAYFDGTIDEVRIYNRALSDEEIGDLSGATLDP